MTVDELAAALRLVVQAADAWCRITEQHIDNKVANGNAADDDIANEKFTIATVSAAIDQLRPLTA